MSQPTPAPECPYESRLQLHASARLFLWSPGTCGGHPQTDVHLCRRARHRQACANCGTLPLCLALQAHLLGHHSQPVPAQGLPEHARSCRRICRLPSRMQVTFQQPLFYRPQLYATTVPDNHSTSSVFCRILTRFLVLAHTPLLRRKERHTKQLGIKFLK